jgi:hypothetical protein
MFFTVAISENCTLSEGRLAAEADPLPAGEDEAVLPAASAPAGPHAGRRAAASISPASIHAMCLMTVFPIPDSLSGLGPF